MNDRDDWEKPRGKGGHLSAPELAKVQEGFQHRRHIRDVARELKCSSRTVTKYYGLFRAEGIEQNADQRLHRLSGPPSPIA